MIRLRSLLALSALLIPIKKGQALLSASEGGSNCRATVTDDSSEQCREVDFLRTSTENEGRNGNNDTDGHRSKNRPVNRRSVPMECTLILAPSTLGNAGWGVFSTIQRKRGDPVVYGDVVIQLSDLNVSTADSMNTMLLDYLWNVEETGGFYEGLTVASVLPGIGMVANGLPAPLHNVLPFVPRVDEGGLTRLDSPGAGAITHYHNYTFFAQKDIAPGGEIFVNYGSKWFKDRQPHLQLTHSLAEDSTSITIRDVEWLRQHGMCLDNLRPIPRSRLQPEAGRSVVATRSLAEGALVAPFPVLPLRRQALSLTRPKQDGTIAQLQQLLLNYCIGHENSSLLLFPYGPSVNLINHQGDETSLANVRLQWSEHQSSDVLDRSLAELDQSPLMLELVATRDIAPGDEIFLDYGHAWVTAWKEHVSKWQPPPNAAKYAPSYVHDDAIRSLRVESELRTLPYPDNIFTSCFYRYSDHKEKKRKIPEDNTSSKDSTDAVVTVQWKQTRGIFELSNLRPCQVLQREHRGGKEGTVFTVRIRNRSLLSPEEVIPKGTIHVVNRVPRLAIRFSDKMYSTDQHLEHAFRHEINGFDGGYPEKWLDLL
jgi:hypothetical protein